MSHDSQVGSSWKKLCQFDWYVSNEKTVINCLRHCTFWMAANFLTDSNHGLFHKSILSQRSHNSQAGSN